MPPTRPDRVLGWHVTYSKPGVGQVMQIAAADTDMATVIDSFSLLFRDPAASAGPVYGLDCFTPGWGVRARRVGRSGRADAQLLSRSGHLSRQGERLHWAAFEAAQVARRPGSPDRREGEQRDAFLACLTPDAVVDDWGPRVAWTGSEPRLERP